MHSQTGSDETPHKNSRRKNPEVKKCVASLCKGDFHSSNKESARVESLNCQIVTGVLFTVAQAAGRVSRKLYIPLTCTPMLPRVHLLIPTFESTPRLCAHVHQHAPRRLLVPLCAPAWNPATQPPVASAARTATGSASSAAAAAPMVPPGHQNRHGASRASGGTLALRGLQTRRPL